MSLLHRQIAERMRLYPQRRGLPLAVVTEPLGLLVSMVAGEMGTKPLQANVGAVFFISYTELIERGRPTDEGINALVKDVHAHLVYGDPVQLRKDEEQARLAASKYESINPPLAKILEEQADILAHDASVNEERLKTTDSTQAKTQLAFSQSFFAFRDRWNVFYTGLKAEAETIGVASDNMNMSGNQVKQTIDEYYERYLKFVESYRKLGKPLSVEPPPPSDVGDTIPDLPPFPKVAEGIGNVFKPLLWGGLAIGGALVFASLYKNQSPAYRTR